MANYRARYCDLCDAVVSAEECPHAEERIYKASPAVSVPFKPGYFHAIGGRASSKRELYEKAARKGVTLTRDQLG